MKETENNRKRLDEIIVKGVGIMNKSLKAIEQNQKQIKNLSIAVSALQEHSEPNSKAIHDLFNCLDKITS